MVDLARPAYDTSAPSSAGSAPADLLNTEWARNKVNLEFALVRQGADPAPNSIPPETLRIVKNTSTGRVSLWVNSGGQIIDLLSFEV